jgi:hypothetical protein
LIEDEYHTHEVKALANKTLRKEPQVVRALGFDSGRINIADDFDSPLPTEIMRCFAEDPDESENRAVTGLMRRKTHRRGSRQP